MSERKAELLAEAKIYIQGLPEQQRQPSNLLFRIENEYWAIRKTVMDSSVLSADGLNDCEHNFARLVAMVEFVRENHPDSTMAPFKEFFDKATEAMLEAEKKAQSTAETK